MHPDDDADRRAREFERFQEQRDLYCPKCGNKRLSVNGQWRCYGCDGAPKGAQ
jgi:ribosomal protein L37AE/L43A